MNGKSSTDRASFVANAERISERAGQAAKEVLEFVDRDSDIRLALAYGSAARGDAKENSDLDVWLESRILNYSPAALELALRFRGRIRSLTEGIVEPYLHPIMHLRTIVLDPTVGSIDDAEFAERVWRDHLVLVDRDDQIEEIKRSLA